MFRLVLGVLLCALASLGLAAFDLQFVNKYNPSGISTNGFSKIVKDNSGGYYAAGKAGVDLLIVRFDSFGSITHTRVWDTPDVLSDSPLRLDMTDSGEPVLVVAAGVYRYLARFTPELVPIWYLKFPGTALAATNRGGVSCYVTPNTSAGTATAQIVTAQGNLSGSVPVSANTLIVVEPCNSTANPGFLIGGNRSNQAFVARITNAAGGVYNSLGNAPAASPLNRVLAVAADSSGIVTAAGMYYDNGDTSLVLFRVSSTGTLTQNQSPPIEGGVQIRKIAIASSTVARLVLPLLSTDRILEFHRSTFATLATYDAPSIQDFAYLASTNELMTASNNNRFYAFEIGGSATTSGFTKDTVAATSNGNDQVITAGSEDNFATMVWRSEQGTFEATFQFPGPINRSLADSDLGSSGVVALGMNQFSPDASTVVAYRSNGTLAFAKGFFPNSKAKVSRVLTLSDGSVFAVGSVEGLTFDSLAACLYSPTGAVVFAKTYPTTGVDQVWSVAYISGSGYYILGSTNFGDASLTRIGGNGAAFWSVPVDLDVSFASDLVATPANDLAVVLRYPSGASVKILDGGSGAVLQSVPLNTSIAWNTVALCSAPGGDLVTMMSRSGTEQTVLQRLNSVTLAEVASYGDTAITTAMDVGTNGRVALLQTIAGTKRIRQLASNLTTPVSTNLEPNLTELTDVAVGPTGLVYIVADELSGGIRNAYTAKYLTNGVRSAVRRLSGTTNEVFAPAGTVWVLGNTPTRAKGNNPYAAKYTP